MTLIHLAAKSGQTTAIRYLLENRRLNVNVKVLSENRFIIHYLYQYSSL